MNHWNRFRRWFTQAGHREVLFNLRVKSEMATASLAIACYQSAAERGAEDPKAAAMVQIEEALRQVYTDHPGAI